VKGSWEHLRAKVQKEGSALNGKAEQEMNGKAELAGRIEGKEHVYAVKRSIAP
jgi:hypothetical protein